MTTVNVTAEHIAKGKRDSCDLCPVALAIQEVISHPVWVDSAHATFGTCRDRFDVALPDVALPDEVTRFIEAFDGELLVEPFTFELDYPAEVAA